MTELDARTKTTLDRLVPPDGAPSAWDDVLDRAGARARRRRLGPILVPVVAVAVLAAAPALGLRGHVTQLLGRKDSQPRLPRAADKAHARPVLVRRDGRRRILVIAAPWRHRNGICWVFSGLSSGCSERSRRALTYAIAPGPGSRATMHGVVFDPRAATVELRYASGDVARTRVVRVGGRIQAGFYVGVVPPPIRPARLVVRDAGGSVVQSLRAPGASGSKEP